MREAQVVAQVRVEVGAIGERHAMPEASGADAAEDAVPLHTRDGEVGRAVVGGRAPLRLERGDGPSGALDAREHT
jgi:hypothetical protein